MNEIQQLILKINELNSQFGELNRFPLSEQNIFWLKDEVNEKYGKLLSNIYIQILQLTNGINFNGVFLYGMDENPSMDIVKCNEDWKRLDGFQNYFFYADSDLYLFVQDKTETYSIRTRDDFETIIFETTEATLFFQKILQCALGIDIEI